MCPKEKISINFNHICYLLSKSVPLYIVYKLKRSGHRTLRTLEIIIAVIGGYSRQLGKRPFFILRDKTLRGTTAMPLLLPLRRIPSFAKPGQSFLSRFTTPPRPYVPRRSFYGYICDTKMAPQLEPFFKQYVGCCSCALDSS